jgi:uncharacterized protein DUF5684
LSKGEEVVAASSGLFAVVYVLVLILEVVGLWMIFGKAHVHEWGAIIPFYNYWLLSRVSGRPGWWMFLLFIPLVNIVIWAVIAFGVAQSFGKSGGFAVGIFFLPFIFLPILGFGEAAYTGTLG